MPAPIPRAAPAATSPGWCTPNQIRDTPTDAAQAELPPAIQNDRCSRLSAVASAVAMAIWPDGSDASGERRRVPGYPARGWTCDQRAYGRSRPEMRFQIKAPANAVAIESPVATAGPRSPRANMTGAVPRKTGYAERSAEPNQSVAAPDSQEWTRKNNLASIPNESVRGTGLPCEWTVPTAIRPTTRTAGISRMPIKRKRA